jgi:hypothetical protein
MVQSRAIAPTFRPNIEPIKNPRWETESCKACCGCPAFSGVPNSAAKRHCIAGVAAKADATHDLNDDQGKNPASAK